MLLLLLLELKESKVCLGKTIGGKLEQDCSQWAGLPLNGRSLSAVGVSDVHHHRTCQVRNEEAAQSGPAWSCRGVSAPLCRVGKVHTFFKLTSSVHSSQFTFFTYVHSFKNEVVHSFPPKFFSFPIVTCTQLQLLPHEANSRKTAFYCWFMRNCSTI